jgi:hypothetical protein
LTFLVLSSRALLSPLRSPSYTTFPGIPVLFRLLPVSCYIW